MYRKPMNKTSKCRVQIPCIEESMNDEDWRSIFPSCVCTYITRSNEIHFSNDFVHCEIRALTLHNGIRVERLQPLKCNTQHAGIRYFRDISEYEKYIHSPTHALSIHYTFERLRVVFGCWWDFKCQELFRTLSKRDLTYTFNRSAWLHPIVGKMFFVVLIKPNNLFCVKGDWIEKPVLFSICNVFYSPDENQEADFSTNGANTFHANEIACYQGYVCSRFGKTYHFHVWEVNTIIIIVHYFVFFVRCNWCSSSLLDKA